MPRLDKLPATPSHSPRTSMSTWERFSAHFPSATRGPWPTRWVLPVSRYWRICSGGPARARSSPKSALPTPTSRCSCHPWAIRPSSAKPTSKAATPISGSSISIASWRRVSPSNRRRLLCRLVPDGNTIAFSSNRSGSFQLYAKSMTGGGEEQLPIATRLRGASSHRCPRRFGSDSTPDPAGSDSACRNGG